MQTSESIVFQDKEISRIIDTHGANAAEILFEEYRTAGNSQYDFVAALIARLCLSEVRAKLRKLNIDQGY